MLIHSVFFWLKTEVSAEQRASFFEGLESLGGIEALAGFYVGTPAATAKRAVIDDSYDYAITCLLPDVAALDAYQVHALHQAFLATHREKCSRVQIYDAA